MSAAEAAAVVRYADLVPVRWRNGGGTTRELLAAASPEQAGEFDWRVSVADVTRAGAFSTFSGVDRTLVLCRGAGMVLTIDGRLHHLGPYDHVRFAGEQSTSADLIDGPTVDLNVMIRRDRVHAAVTLEELASREDTVLVSTAPGTLVLVVVLEGAVVLRGGRSTGSSLQPFDALAVHAADPRRFVGTGRMARVVLTPVDPDRPVRPPDPTVQHV